MKFITLSVAVEVPSKTSEKRVAKLTGRLLDVGLEDAAVKRQKKEGNLQDAKAVSSWRYHSPRSVPQAHELLYDDPAGYLIPFTAKQWRELECLSMVLPVEPDVKYHRAYWITLGHVALGKAQRVAAGEYGDSSDDEAVDINAWAEELRGIAAAIFSFKHA